MRAPVLALLAAASLAAPRPAHAGAYLHLLGFFPSLDGDLAREASSGSTEIDLDRDIGFGRDLAFEGRAGATLGRNRFSAGGAVIDHATDAARAAFELGGTTFDAQARVESRLAWVEGEYAYAPIDTGRGRLELLAGARLYRYRGSAEGTAFVGPIPFTRTESVDETGPVPHLGAAIELRPIPSVAVRATGKGFRGGVGDDRGHTLDLEGTVGVRLGRLLEVGGGVRLLDLFVSVDDGESEFDLRYRALAGYVRLAP